MRRLFLVEYLFRMLEVIAAAGFAIEFGDWNEVGFA